MWTRLRLLTMSEHEIDGFKNLKRYTLISLFTSTGTLLCCALPALMVTLGAGAVLAGLVSAVPWLVFLSQYKVWTFTVAGVMLIFAGYMKYRARYLPCPAQPAQAKLCQKMRRVSNLIYGLSVLIYAIGFFFAFVAVHLFY